MTTSISIILPVLNEPGLNDLLPRIHEAMQSIPENYEILIVKGDRETKFYSHNAHPRQREIKTYGDSLERSILNGFSQATGGKIIVMDADGSHPPETIPQLLRALDRFELVVGSRFVEGSEFKSSISRRLVSWNCIWLARRAGSKLSDPMSGYFAIRRELLDRAKFAPLPWKVCLELELKTSPRIVEIPIHFEERIIGKSKTTVKVGLKIVGSLFCLVLKRGGR